MRAVIRYTTMWLNQKGDTLISVMIAAAIGTVITLGIATALVSQQREVKGLSQKLEALSLEKVLISSLATGAVCKYILNNPTQLTFDSTALPQTIQSDQFVVYANVEGGVPGPIIAQKNTPPFVLDPNIIVSDISLIIENGVGTSFTGYWRISLDGALPDVMVRPLKPIHVSTNIIADISTPSAAKFTDCSTAMGGATSGISEVAPSSVGTTECAGQRCLNAASGDGTAQRVCYQKGYKGALSSGGNTNDRCNSCVYGIWTGPPEDGGSGSWSFQRRCNSCGYITNVVCYR